MLISLGFLVLIVLMSAGIAVIADNVGRKLGKKRMSFKCRAFSVRPKYVAQIGTALTGAAVSLATIVVVALVSKDVRDWIVMGRAAIAQAEAASAKNRQLQNQITERETTIQSRDAAIKTKENEIRQKTTEVAARTKEVEAGRLKVKEQRTALAKLNGEVAKMRSEIPRLQGDVGRARRSYEDANRKLQERQSRLASVSKELTSVSKQLVANKAMLDEATKQKNEISDQNTQLLAENGTLESKNKALEAEQRKLQADVANFGKARDEALQELDSSREALSAVQGELATAKNELQALKKDLYDARYWGSFYEDISTVPRIAPITFRMQEEVARVTIEDGLSHANAEAAMTRLLRAARLAALERGAKPTDLYPEAGIFARRNPTTKETVSGDELQRRIVRQIVGGYQSQVLVAYSSLNAFKGEPVSLDVVVYPNPLVYKQGQLIAESKVDGRRDDSEIYRQVSDFVGAKLRARARQDRMIPRAGSEEAYAAINGETMLKLVGDVKAAERPVRLIALAASDTRAGDPLKLAFQIR
ncbi:MAG: DUF3084 domain-containing protein [Fimbriimonas sp.]